MRLLAHRSNAFPFEKISPFKPVSFAVGLALALVVLAGCRTSRPPGEGTSILELKSSSFRADAIPKPFTCDADDKSPALAWGAPPPATQSFALTIVDIDAPVGSFVHWVLYDLPPQTRDLPEGFPKQDQLPDASRQGINDFDKIGYGGPCPPDKSPHRYVFSLYAVDSKLNLPASATRKQLEKALQGHVLAHGELTGKYQR
jgi:Raf kinase inhibitor-like YbhB/YbcL family protein